MTAPVALQRAQLEILRVEPVMPMPLPAPLPTYAPPHPPGPKSSRLTVVLGLLGAVACLFSAGILIWCVFAVMAALRRSRALTVVSVIYAVLFTFWMFAIPPQLGVPFYSLRTAIGSLALIVTAVGGALHVGFLTLAPPRNNQTAP